MNKGVFFVFVLHAVIFSEEQHFWDLGVKINKVETKQLKAAQEIKKTIDDSLFEEVVDLSNKLKISQKIIDQENRILSAKIKEQQETPTLIFNSNKNKKNSQEEKSKGLNAYQLGRYKDALQYLDKINNSETTKVEKNKINYLKANAYFNLGELKKTQEYLEKVILNEQTQLLDDALLLRGIVLKQQGKNKEALKIFSQIIYDHPNSEFYESAKIQKRILTRKNEK